MRRIANGVVIAAVVGMLAGPALGGTTTRVGLAVQPQIQDTIMSADGRYFAFASAESGLVPGDTNGVTDIFVYDRVTGVTERVSVASDGTQANAFSAYTAISAGGRFVTFVSRASNLATGDTNFEDDVFIHDRLTGTTELVSVASDGSQANGPSSANAVSADGRFVLFNSFASNLVPGDTNVCGSPSPTGNCADEFVRDRLLGTTERVDVASDGSQANQGSAPYGLEAISADGRFVAFVSRSTNLVAGGTSGVENVFVHDRTTGTTQLISVATDGSPGNQDSGGRLSISADGRFVAFFSYANTLVPGGNGSSDVFVRDRLNGTTEVVSVSSTGERGNSDDQYPWISPDGRYVAFSGFSTNLVHGDTNTCPPDPTPGACRDVFVHDRQTGRTVRVNLAPDGSQADGGSSISGITNDGIVAFTSDATNMIAGDTNGATDMFVRAPVCGDGLLDPGEECDSGSLNGTGGSCCTVTCEYRTAGEICRPAAGTCDFAEACTGASGDCPANIITPDGTACDDGNSCTLTDICHAGVCVGGNLSWSGVLQPINPDGSSIFKLGNTIPVKFQLTGACSAITNLVANIFLSKVTNAILGTEIETSSTSAADTGNTFRYDPTANQYIYNLATKSLSAGTWQIRIDFHDGVANRTVRVSLK